MAGRRTKYTPETIKKLQDAIGLGAAYKHACDYAGITFETFNQWREHKPGFSDQIKEAEGRAVVGWMRKIEAAATDGNWTAAAWKLERRYPHDYGKTVNEHQLTGKDGERLGISDVQLTAILSISPDRSDPPSE